MRAPIFALLGLSLLGVGACGSSGGSADADDSEGYICTGDPRAETFHADLEKMGASGMIDFVLHSSDPAPPAKGNNVWIVQLNGMSGGVVGSPMTGATINVRTFMPDHNHMGVGATVTDQGGGMYKLSPVDTFMPGYWEITLTATGTDSTTDKAVYKFCIST
jgi:hypothetical protein